jgi:hypothetical protein
MAMQMENRGSVYGRKADTYLAENVKLEDFEDMDPAYLNPRLREIHQKLQAEAKPKEPSIEEQVQFETSTDLFAS